MDRKLRKRVLDFANDGETEYPLYTHLCSKGTLDGWDVYRPDPAEFMIIGLPQYVLVRGDEIRWNSREEQEILQSRER
ncbi:MAG: hypothetical protein Q4Q62_04670 [Thermoplasmata archaeon]|nr:hypothetical protein [Thermoplasmata archaeon]